jgi:hypothetical protein
MYLIQILLPVTEAPESGTRFKATRDELADRFGGVTAYTRSAAQGIWTSPEGHEDRDLVVMVEVVTEEFDTSWWGPYRDRLAERFQQKEIHIRALRAEVP